MTIDNDERVRPVLSGDGTEAALVETVPVGATLPVRLWNTCGGVGGQGGSVMAKTLNVWGDEAALLRRILEGYLGDLRVGIPAADDPVMRRDLREEEELVRNVLDRLA